MAKQTLADLPDKFTKYSLSVYAEIPYQVLNATLYFIGKNHHELSIGVLQAVQLNSDSSVDNCTGLKVFNPLDFLVGGIMRQIGYTQAIAKNSIFILSMLEVNCFLDKQKDLDPTASPLPKDDYKVIL